MYDENKWNEVNNENEKKNNEQPVNTQNTQNTQNGAQQPQGEHTGRQVYGRLGSGTQNGQPYNGNPNGQNGYYGGQQHFGNQNQYTNRCSGLRRSGIVQTRCCSGRPGYL